MIDSVPHFILVEECNLLLRVKLPEISSQGEMCQERIFLYIFPISFSADKLSRKETEIIFLHIVIQTCGWFN